MGTRIIGIIVMTFMIAIFYGLFLTTENFLQPDFNPVATGHQAANNIYGLFGTISNEIKQNEPRGGHDMAVAHKLAMPYAVTADLSAILGGKLEVSLASLFHQASTDAHS